MNFFQLIDSIDVNEGTKVKFRDTVYTYGIWNNTHAYWFITEDKGATVPPRASEQGWELVKPVKKVNNIEAINRIYRGEVIRDFNGALWMMGCNVFLSKVEGRDFEVASSNMDVWNSNGDVFEVVE